jgi:hypothetical protein
MVVEGVVGAQPITKTTTVQNHPLGKIIKARDIGSTALGEAEFIYLQGVASTVVGSVVIWDSGSFQTTLAPAGNNKPQPVAFAMSANVASQFGWYQISGLAVALKTSGLALASNVAVGVLTAGKIAGTASGKEVQGAITQAKASVPTSVTLIINRPEMQGRVS